MNTNMLFPQLFNEKVSAKIALQYTGFFSQHTITSLGEVLRLWLDEHEASVSQRRKLFSTFVEMAQNILRYSSDPRKLQQGEQEMRFGAFCLSVSASRYSLESANLVSSEESQRLRGQLETLRDMSLDEIKQEWKTSLRAETPVWSKGANIGLLTLARDASQPLEFIIQQVDETDMSAFYLKATI